MADNDATANDSPSRPHRSIQFEGNWADLTRSLDVGGVARQLAQQSELKRFDAGVLDITVPPSAKHLLQKAYVDKLTSALEQHFGTAIRLNIEVAEAAGTSAQDQAVAAINQDQFVHELLDQFDGSIVDSSIQPIPAKAEQQRRKT